MKAMLFAAGMGTRLKPLTDTMPKALVPVGGTPMLQHVILKLKASGFDDITINIHHFGEQILTFLHANNNFGVTIHISDERDRLLDTGGGIKKARSFLENDGKPFLVHNVDILSNVDLRSLYQQHIDDGCEATLLVSPRDTSRYLLFDGDKLLHGWVNKKTGETKPAGFEYVPLTFEELAFAGIHIFSPSLFPMMDEIMWGDKFSIIDFYIAACRLHRIGGYCKSDLKLLDIGKPETLATAAEFLRTELK